MAVNIRGLTRIKSQALVNFPPQPSLNLDFTTPYVNGLNPLPSTVSFTRSDAGAYATHVGPDGLMRRAAHNITVPSAPGAGWDFVSFTSSFNTSETTAPDGSSTAAKISNDDSGAAGYHYLRSGVTTTIANNTYVWSGYLKKGTITVVQILCQGTTSQDIWANFDLNAGAIGNKGTATTAYMTSVGNGWYRCSISGTSIANNNSEAVFFSGTNNNSSVTRIPQYTGSVSNYFYVWGAQLEQNITPSYYVPTTSAAVYSTPRYDYDPVTLQPKGLLIEEARTNLVTSSTFQTAITVQAGTLTTNSATSPTGETNGATFIVSNTFGQGNLYHNKNLNGTYTLSVYAKKTGPFNYYINVDPTNSGSVLNTPVFDLQNGTVLQSAGYTVSITPAGFGFYRLAVTFTVGSGNYDPGFYATNSLSTRLFWGDGASGWILFGFQIEAGNFASSYIPTTSGSVTRARDDVLLTGTANTIASGAVGTMYIETTSLKTRNSGLTDQILFGNASKDQLYRSVAQGNILYTYQFRTGLATLNSADWTNPVKSIVAFDASSASICLAGGAVASGSGSLAMTGNTYVGSDGTGAQFINGNVRQVLLYDFRMPDNKLPIITKG